MSNTKVTADYAITPRQLFKALVVLVAMQRPTMIWGPPGIAKSQLAQQVAAYMGMQYHDVRALLMDNVDLRGIPWRDPETGMTRWAPPSFLPASDSLLKHLINLEELPNALPTVQAALYQLVLDRLIGEYRLPEGAALIACGNRVNDRGGAHRMPSPLANRFTHLTLKHDREDWLDWAVGTDEDWSDGITLPNVDALKAEKAAGRRICTEVMFYQQLRPEALGNFDPKKSENAFCSPRSWEMESDFTALGGTGDPEVDLAIRVGTIGEAQGVDFNAFLDIWRQLPHPQTVFDNPKGVPMPEDEGAKIALCGALSHSATPELMEPLCTFAARADLRVEVGQFLVSQTVKAKPECQQTRAYVSWAQALSRV